MAITALPPPPDRASPSTFAAKGDALLSALPTFVTEANALQADVNAKQVSAATQVTLATTQANNALASATAAAASATASIWVSGTTYAIGNVRFSPINFQNYRRKTAGAGTTDPSLDATNWGILATIPTVAGDAGKILSSNGTTLSWSEGIPIQSGNTGKVLKTNGTNILWDYEAPMLPAINGGVLTAKGGAYVILDNGNYTLPDLTGYPSFCLLSSSSAAALPASVATSDGWNIGTGFVAGTSKVIMPTYTGNAHGVWGSGLSVTPPVLASAAITMTANRVLRASVKIDANKTLFIIDPNSSAVSRQYFAVIYDNSTNTLGTPALMTASALSPVYQCDIAVKVISATSFALARNITSTSAQMVVATISGTTITFGTPWTHATKPFCTSDLGNNACPPQFIMLSSTLFLGLVNSGGGAIGSIAFSVSGATITAGTELAISSVYGPRIIACSATTALMINQTGGNNVSNTGAARVISISGTTCTANASVATESNLAGSDTNTIFEEFATGTTYLYGAKTYNVSTTNLHCLTVSGTTVTVGAATATTILGGYGSRSYDYPLLSGYASCTALNINSTTILAFINSVLTPITLSGTTISIGTSYANYSGFYFDIDNNVYTYNTSTAALSRITASGSTITIVESVAQSIPSALLSATLTSNAIKYNSTWYAWNIASGILAAATNNKLLFVNAANTNLQILGPMS